MSTTTTVRETSTYRAMGFTDEITKCEHCGRDDLKGTIRMVLIDQDGNEDGEQYMGTVCAARMTGRKTTDIRTEAARNDRARRDAARAEFVAWQDSWTAVERPLTDGILARLGMEREPRAMRVVHSDPEYVAVRDAWNVANPRPTAYDDLFAARTPRKEVPATGQSSRPDWTQMRASDFDTDAPLTLFDLRDIPAQPVSEGDETTLF